MGNIISIGFSKFWTFNDVLHIQFRNKKKNNKFQINEAKLFVKSIDALCNNKPMPFLIDVRDSNGTFTAEAANLIANSPTLLKLRISEAFVINTISAKIGLASYKRTQKPINPYSVFGDIQSAKDYCLETKNNFYGSN
ncbi:hypothetical protein Q4512_00500 [Oceanihabitans sp. 2_MG-2023]|uniref:DUF7793 family protein n=1 Tax=Oceanihabitans sp. 2_MG-2023 TaxID=3062661 RepID=UPI0026E1BBB8|nr:hypothetical protein [Oceanihabitans sp. 2_MG-2023]MDO6595369.1 hypothetical protein [Oceanihabitans sp. 2_MG-2023]